jgi:peptide/nickel transport system substrate-binding protein
LFTTALVLFLTLVLLGHSLERNVMKKSQATVIDKELASRHELLRQPVLDYANPPAFQVEVDYAEGRDGVWWPKGESPILAELVEKGKLPPVAERVGTEPVVYRGFGGIGRYGGDWWRLAEDIDTVRMAMQYELANTQFVRHSPYGEPFRPHLARRVEPNRDCTVWIVELRRGVRWSDGTPFTAEDIIWWWENVDKNPEVGVIGGDMRVDGRPGEIEKIDDYTLRYTFPVAHPGWLEAIAWAGGAARMAGPKHYMKQFHPKLGNQELIQELCRTEMLTPKALFQKKNHPLNTERPKLGPWIFRTYSSVGPWTAVRNPYYFAVDEKGNQLPYLDRLVFRQVGGGLQAKAVTDGLTSFAPAPVGTDYSSLLSTRKAGNYSVQHWVPDSRGALTIVPNRTKAFYTTDPVELKKAALLDNPEFRRALSIAINRQTIIDAELKGVGQPATMGPPPGLPWYDPELLKINAGYAPERAAAHLGSFSHY